MRVPGGVSIGRAWRIGPSGVVETYVVAIVNETTASVCSRAGKGWTQKPKAIHRADLFATREAARAEYRRRRAAASPESSRNFTTDVEG